METLIWLKRIRVENANCIHGMTWGFPAITNFLGFTHALSRQLGKDFDFRLNACAVVAHETQPLAHSSKGFEYRFSQTRNPLTKKGKTAPINQEGRMHMTISLLLSSEQLTSQLELSDSVQDDEKQLKQAVIGFLHRTCIAGGSVPALDDKQVEILSLGAGEERETLERRVRMNLLPGFALVDRSELLPERLEALRKEDSTADLLDALLSFSELRYQYDKDEKKEGKGKWKPVSKQGYLVPICRGFKAISPLCEAGQVVGSRDPETPFRLVESAYGVGQWLSPHRCQSVEQLLWHYQYRDDWYLAESNYQPEMDNTKSTHV